MKSSPPIKSAEFPAIISICIYWGLVKKGQLTAGNERVM